jgi:alkylhydroperoxidase/carboxymuconolactone decarboxylase family protein YurZ
MATPHFDLFTDTAWPQSMRPSEEASSCRPGDAAMASDGLDDAVASGIAPGACGVPCSLDDKTRALVRLSALIAIGGGADACRRQIAAACAAGATDGEVVDVLLVVAPTIGMAGLVSSSIDVARGLGYDIDLALEQLDDPRIEEQR